MITTKRCLRIRRKDISFLRFIFEAYDGIAILTTIDPQEGLIAIYIAPGCEREVELLMESLKKDININYQD
ncbi:MAG: DUF4911 domain-containing protein [Desulfobacterales bacterium]|nr:DUF4911 domain-containing protein [Desulfobacterales bacterium]MBF0395867.1 DUF4911 domain-containing protein [Desulfobacterales bacterium]